MQKSYQSIRIFKSDFCEKFTHVHPLTPLVIWSPVVIYFFYSSFVIRHLSAIQVGGLAALGFFFWTLCEYLLHRFIFHFNAEGKTEEKLQFLIHGLHHSDPVDASRLVMPPFPAIVLGLLFYGIFRGLLGHTYVDPFFGAFIVGYLCYDYIHFAIHHFNPKTKLGKLIKQHHMQHHFVTPHARWGVSSPIWDHVFGTVEETDSLRHGS